MAENNGIAKMPDYRTIVQKTGAACRIPEEAVSGSPLEIATGDKITCGDITATVLDWHDNRGRPSPHWYVEAS